MFQLVQSQILFQKCVLHIFRNPGTCYLQFVDKQNRRYEFPKFKHFSIFKTKIEPGLIQGQTRGAILLVYTDLVRSVFSAVGFK
jgi:hypothetical protein